jgi:cobaltochelatase CobS
MFIIQRVLESDGKFTLLDKNRIIKPNAFFRLFATTNTVGLGDTTGLYHGTQQINQGQMDRWNIVTTLNYLKMEQEKKIIHSKVPSFNTKERLEIIDLMIRVADLTRNGLANGDISTVMSPRTVLTWAENSEIFDFNYSLAFKLTFLNKCDDSEKQIISEYYQRCFGDDISNISSEINLV